MKQFFVALTILLCFTSSLKGIVCVSLGDYTNVATPIVDTTSSVAPFDTISLKRGALLAQKIDKWSSTDLYQMTFIGIPLIASGIIVKSQDDHFRSLRNDYLPHFRHHLDDYLQFSPAAVLLGLKSCGIDGRSSWGRMMTADAFSVAVMATAVNTLKQTTHVERPDGSDRHSFPSGHTATAFMTATMLTKEYGGHSPWIGFGAYATASATGLMRMANNKHWLSDVLTGAGIGILSTEIGYYISDCIFKSEGLNQTNYAKPLTISKHSASFLNLYVGMNVPLSKYDIDESNEFSTSSGSSTGIEGAYFINPYIGFGGRFNVSNTHIIVNSQSAEDNTFDAISLCGGSYFSLPISSRWSVGSKLIGGYIHYPRLTLANQTIYKRSGVCFGSGISASFRARDHYGIIFFADYNLQPSHTPNSGEWMNTLTWGFAFGIMF